MIWRLLFGAGAACAAFLPLAAEEAGPDKATPQEDVDCIIALEELVTRYKKLPEPDPKVTGALETIIAYLIGHYNAQADEFLSDVVNERAPAYFKLSDEQAAQLTATCNARAQKLAEDISLYRYVLTKRRTEPRRLEREKKEEPR